MKKRIISIVVAIALILALPFQMMQMVGAQALDDFDRMVMAAQNAKEGDYSPEDWQNLQSVLAEALAVKDAEFVTVKATSNGNSGKLLTASDSEYVYLSDLATEPTLNQIWKRVTTSQGFQLINAATGKYLYLSDEVYHEPGYAKYTKQGNIADIDEAATYLEIKDNCLAFIKRYNNVTVTMHFNHGNNASKIYTWANTNSDRTCSVDSIETPEALITNITARLKTALLANLKTLEDCINAAKAEKKHNYSDAAWAELQAALEEAQNPNFVTVKVTSGGNSGKLLTASDSEYVYLSDLSGTPNSNQTWKRITTSQGFQLINAATGKYLYLSDEVYNEPAYAKFTKQGNIADIDEAATYLEIKDNCLAFIKRYNNVTVTMHFNHGNNASKIYTWANANGDRTCVIEDAPVPAIFEEQSIARIKAAILQRKSGQTLEELIELARAAREEDYSVNAWANLQRALAQASGKVVAVKVTGNKYLTAATKDYVYLTEKSGDLTPNQTWVRVDVEDGKFQLINMATGNYLYISDEEYAGNPAAGRFVKQGPLSDEKTIVYMEGDELTFEQKVGTSTVGCHFGHNPGAEKIVTWGIPLGDSTCEIQEIEASAECESLLYIRLQNALALDQSVGLIKELGDLYNTMKDDTLLHYDNEADYLALKDYLAQAENLLNGNATYVIHKSTKKAMYAGFENAGKGNDYVGFKSYDETDSRQVWYKVTTNNGFSLINASLGEYLYLSDEKRAEFANNDGVDYSFYLKVGKNSDFSAQPDRANFKVADKEDLQPIYNPSSLSPVITVAFEQENNLFTWASSNAERAITFNQVSGTVINELAVPLVAAMKDIETRRGDGLRYTEQDIKDCIDAINEKEALKDTFTTKSWDIASTARVKAQNILSRAAVKIVVANDDDSKTNFGKIVDVKSNDNHSPITLNDEVADNMKQYWYKIDTGDGYFQLINVDTGKYMYISSDARNVGADYVDWTYYIKQADIELLDIAARTEFKELNGGLSPKYNESETQTQIIEYRDANGISTWSSGTSVGKMEFQDVTLPAPTQEQINTIVVAMQDAINGLQTNTTPADSAYKAELQALIDEVEAEIVKLDEDNAPLYTTASISVTESKIQLAKQALAKDGVTYKEIDEASTALLQSKDRLIKNATYVGLYNAIETIGNKNEEQFQPKTWALVLEAKDAARDAFDNPEKYTDVEMNVLIANIKEAISKLVDRADKEALIAIVNLLNNLNFNEEDFQADTWLTFNITYSTAKAILEDLDAPQEGVDDLQRELVIATNSLRLKATGEQITIFPGSSGSNTNNNAGTVNDRYNEGYNAGYEKGKGEQKYVYVEKEPSETIQEVREVKTKTIEKTYVKDKLVKFEMEWWMIALICLGGIIVLGGGFFLGRFAQRSASRKR